MDTFIFRVYDLWLCELPPITLLFMKFPTILKTEYLEFSTAYFFSIPFLGFGFLDNTIMLCAGEYIDLSLGSVLGELSVYLSVCLSVCLSEGGWFNYKPGYENCRTNHILS